jgi:hypothetical protein
MAAKRVIQVYKAPHQWINSPPGLGDFVRGICHLVEKLRGSGIELRVDVSQTGFAALIDQDPEVFQSGDEQRIASAQEYFVDHVALHDRLVAFLHSGESELYVCTNVGAWNRPTIPDDARAYARRFYSFNESIEQAVAQALPAPNYEVLSVRCGDQFYNDPGGRVHTDIEPVIHSLIEQQILPQLQFPLVVTSDCHELKLALQNRYGLQALPHRSQHGAFESGSALPVAMDMCMLKHSRFNHHINTWATWWSGFSHYTSVIFQIPSANFRAPQFVRESITAQGELLTG